MGTMNEQTARIQQMEQYLDCASTAIKELSDALEKYLKAQAALSELGTYYGSEQWKEDFAADEAGLLPSDLKRGVLSEDGIWNVLSDSHELNIRLSEVLTYLLRHHQKM